MSAPPAAARVVPRPEKKIEGAGVAAETVDGHFDVSSSTMGRRDAPVAVGARRHRLCTVSIVGRERSVERMLPP